MLDAIKALFEDGFQNQDIIDVITLIVKAILNYVATEEGLGE